MKNERITKELTTKITTITVKNLGPIKSATINVGDLTALIGLPNSGKSYLLRSVYWYLQLLDEKAYSRFLDNTTEASGLQFFVSYSWKTDEESLTVKTLKYIATLFENFYEFSRNRKTHKDIGITNIEMFREEIMRAGPLSESIEVNYELDTKIPKKELRNRIQSIFTSSLSSLTGASDINSISISGKTIDEILDEAIEGITLNPDRRIEKSSISYQPFLSFGRTKDGASYIIERVLRSLPFKLKLSVSFNQIENETLKCNINAKMGLDKEHFIPRSLDILENASLYLHKNYLSTIEKRLNSKDSEEYYPLETDIQIIEMALEMVSNDFLERCISEMRSNIAILANIKSVKFVPYGRNAMIQLQSYANKRGAKGENSVVDILKDVKGVPYLSYFQWLIEGRAQLSDAQSDLQNLFSLIIGGQILNSDDNASIGFSYQKGKSVDIGLSSAMVEELTGMLLPMLVVKEGELLIIEEPEAQLHVRVQIMMGLLLLSIAKLKNLKILFSTHSDLLALTIAYISELKSSASALNELVTSVMPDLVTDKIALGRLTQTIFDATKQVDTKTYYLEAGKNSVEMNSIEMEKSIPSISNTVDAFLDWVFREKAKVAKKETKTNDSKPGDTR